MGILVRATREGLVGGKTYTGYKVDRIVPFVALPSVAAMHLWVKVYNPLTNITMRALVLDVGPWNTTDHAYVFQPSTLGEVPPDPLSKETRPQAESGKDTIGRKTNGAGIDLGERVWVGLGMVDNSNVIWSFE